MTNNNDARIARLHALLAQPERTVELQEVVAAGLLTQGNWEGLNQIAKGIPSDQWSEELTLAYAAAYDKVSAPHESDYLEDDLNPEFSSEPLSGEWDDWEY